MCETTITPTLLYNLNGSIYIISIINRFHHNRALYKKNLA